MEQGSTRAAELDCGESFPVELSLPLPPPPPSVPSAQKEGVREDGVERPLGDVLRGQENNSRPGGSFGGGGEFLLRERRDERRYGEESEQGSTSAMEVAGVATPPRSILDSRPELEGCAPRDGWRKLGTRPRRHGVRAGRWYTTWVVVCDRFLERWGMVVEGEECGRVMGQWILYEIIYSNYEFV